MTGPAESQPDREGEAVVLSPPPEQARQLFGRRLDLAERYADRLATDGVLHGHIGPREVPRLWGRHLINSALVAELIPPGASVLDVGSGAGLPGLPIAIRRADVRVTLLEPMLRRSLFLSGCVDALGLADQVRVVRARAEDGAVVSAAGGADWLVARAVAPLDRLATLCLPLLAPGGTLLAMKGSSARDEVTRYRDSVQRLGGDQIEVVELGEVGAGERAWVVSIHRGIRAEPQRKARRR